MMIANSENFRVGRPDRDDEAEVDDTYLPLDVMCHLPLLCMGCVDVL